MGSGDVLPVKYEHVYASQEKYNLEVVKLSLDGEFDEREALENGWLIYNGVWFQCRSVRIKVDEFRPKELPDELGWYHQNTPPAAVDRIYESYIAHKGFDRNPWPVWRDWRATYIVISNEYAPVAFTKLNHYCWGLEAQLTAWDYHKPKLSVGKLIVSKEVEIAQRLGYSHLYIGEGCEAGSIYKADFGGFEWWTGSRWSTDREEYKRLCARDSAVTSIADLSRVFNE